MNEFRELGIVADPEGGPGSIIALDYIPLDPKGLGEAVDRFFIGMDLQQEPLTEIIERESSGSEEVAYVLQQIMGRLIDVTSRVKDTLDITTNQWWSVTETYLLRDSPKGVVKEHWLEVDPAESGDDMPLISIRAVGKSRPLQSVKFIAGQAKIPRAFLVRPGFIAC